MKHYVWGIILTAAFVVIGLYFAYDPTTEGWFPKCRIYQLTGYKCPGCGSQRMLHSLLHGDVVGAFRHNAYLMTLFPVVVVLLVWNGWMKHLSPKWADVATWLLVAMLLISFVLWWVLRNVFGW